MDKELDKKIQRWKQNFWVEMEFYGHVDGLQILKQLMSKMINYYILSTTIKEAIFMVSIF